MKLNSHCESRFRRRPPRFLAFRVSRGNPLASLKRRKKETSQGKERKEDEEEEEKKRKKRRVEKNQKGKEGWNQFLGGISERSVLASLYRPSLSFSNLSFLPYRSVPLVFSGRTRQRVSIDINVELRNLEPQRQGALSHEYSSAAEHGQTFQGGQGEREGYECHSQTLIDEIQNPLDATVGRGMATV